MQLKQKSLGKVIESEVRETIISARKNRVSKRKPENFHTRRRGKDQTPEEIFTEAHPSEVLKIEDFAQPYKHPRYWAIVY